jgi:hypothetical protein
LALPFPTPLPPTANEKYDRKYYFYFILHLFQKFHHLNMHGISTVALVAALNVNKPIQKVLGLILLIS